MLRTLLLYLSDASWAKSIVMHVGLARRVAYRFVAGDTLEQALDVVQTLNSQGMDVTLDYLGESVTSAAGANLAVEQYHALLTAIAERNLKATVSLKLSQLGLDVDQSLCIKNMQAILQHAAASNNQVTIDMESADYTDVTLAIFRKLFIEGGYTNVGTVIQAYLYRSDADMKSLLAEGAFVRLCKGAYMEPPDIAFPLKEDVDANYIQLAQAYVDGASATGAYLGLATHDETIIDTMRQHTSIHQISPDHFEFQMLYGIRTELQQKLAADGYTMRVYVPFGTQWYPYFMRRLAERPANLWFFVSNFLKR